MADFDRPPQPCGPDQPRLAARLPFRHVAVVKGQLTGLQVAAHEHRVRAGGDADPGPGVPAAALRSLASGADFPAARGLQQFLYCFFAGQDGAAVHGEPEVLRYPQHVRLFFLLQVLPQLRAGAVDLVPAGEIGRDAVGGDFLADLDRQLALRAEPQVKRQPGAQGPHRILDVLFGDPLPEPDQRVPGVLPHQRRVHRVNPVRHAVRAPHVLAFDAGSAFAFLLLPCLIQGQHRQPALPPAPFPRC
jgi:hypothetical protein